MSDNTLWYGYLEAGERSSPVAMDSRLNTGDPTTVYVFNLQRGEILEYKRAIVEPKLRELKASEKELETELKNAYRKARNGFTPRGAKVVNIPEKGRPATAKTAAVATDFGGDDYDEEIFVDDADDDEDEGGDE
ncbi:hypothetical protein [Sulfurivermis fontis]|uniref:hypothetical protein n=1 Tax=Sulfurivermis fontis TaxID=1972068 RepID=UPI000FDC2B5B|nr:hypothetical protein [Sulfurivermis fontis]